MPEPTSIKGRVITELMKETLDYVASLEAKVQELEEENKLLQGDTIPPVVSAAFIADYAGVSVSTVGDWFNRGIIKAKKQGRRWIAKREDFLAWLNKDETKPPQLRRAK